MALPNLLLLRPKELYAIFAQGALGKHSLEYLERAGLFNPAIWGKVIGMDNDGDLVWLPQDSTGRAPVLEQSGASILTQVSYVPTLVSAARRDAVAHFGAPSAGEASLGVADNYGRRIMSVTLTSTVAGEIAAADLVAALAGYQSCCVITSLWSDQTDASISMTITTTSGLSNGPGTWAWATTANLVTDYSPGVAFRGSADNEAITVACAAGQAGNTQTIVVMGERFYET